MPSLTATPKHALLQDALKTLSHSLLRLSQKLSKDSLSRLSSGSLKNSLPGSQGFLEALSRLSQGFLKCLYFLKTLSQSSLKAFSRLCFQALSRLSLSFSQGSLSLSRLSLSRLSPDSPKALSLLFLKRESKFFKVHGAWDAKAQFLEASLLCLFSGCWKALP